MIAPEQTKMFHEAQESAIVVARQFEKNARLMQDVGKRLRQLNPSIVFTCARGSSDHAATFAKYLFETRLRVATSSQAPSISSIYGGALLHMQNVPFILISQSGRSPDLLLSAEAAKAAGALVIAIVNDEASPLAELADIVIPVHAGPELSIAATKSYIATLAALVHFAAVWGEDGELLSARAKLSSILEIAWQADWSAALDTLMSASSLFVLGRGLTLGIAQEAALKFKETSGIHAEAFSAAEVAHGPMALVKSGFPVLVLPPQDQAALGIDKIINEFSARGAIIACAGNKAASGLSLPLQDNLHPALAPIAMIQSFYRLVNATSVKRGYNPDSPQHLNKVTQTI
jgi:glutamine---fructose-6-phosphate transaminase (isomerizing)